MREDCTEKIVIAVIIISDIVLCTMSKTDITIKHLQIQDYAIAEKKRVTCVKSLKIPLEV